MSRHFYKGQYCLAFYNDKDEIIHVFDNIREIVDFLELPITRANTQYIKLLLYRALRRQSHITHILGSKMKVYMIDINENEDNKEEN